MTATANTTPFTGPHGSFWATCGICNGTGTLVRSDCTDYDECDAEECDYCHGNGGYWDCVDDLCAALIDEWNW